MQATIDATEERHPMRLVVLRTGLTPDLLRAWEKRYGVVEPVRSQGGQRLYSDADVERLSLLARAVNGGRAIGQIAKLPLPELQRIVEKDASAPRVAPAGPANAGGSESRESVQAEALAAINRFDAAELEATLRGAALRLGMDEMLDGVIGPLFSTIGARWHAGLLSPAHEHLATAVVRRTLTWMMENGTPPPTAPALVVATPAGQAHELGAMLAAAAASSQGWRVVYLGANLPASEIAVVANHTRASAVALSLVHPAHDPAIDGALRELRAALPAGTAIVAGGTAAASYAHALAAVGASRFGSIRELRTWLRGATTTS
jgi:DNA-binding transcriptional MerR regulator/methylmalonyl-CoA mutase cobalamin-binding subunit